MKKLTLLLITILLSVFSYGQTQYDSLNNKYTQLKQRQDMLELNIGNFHQARRNGRITYIVGMATQLLGVLAITSASEEQIEVGKVLIIGGSGLIFVGTINFHLGDISLKKYNKKLLNNP